MLVITVIEPGFLIGGLASLATNRAGCWLLLRARLLRPLPRHARRDRGPTPRRRATNRAATPG